VIEAPGWLSPARVEWCSTVEQITIYGSDGEGYASINPIDYGFDETGDLAQVGTGGDDYWPVWPPVGCNIVISVPNPQLFDAWPRIYERVAVSGRALVADPQKIGQVVPAAAVVVQAEPQPAVMQREDDSLAKVKQLKELLDTGAITQTEFDDKKKALLDKI
jgi:hypothetical protein